MAARANQSPSRDEDRLKLHFNSAVRASAARAARAGAT